MTPKEERAWARVARSVRRLPGVEAAPVPEPMPDLTATSAKTTTNPPISADFAALLRGKSETPSPGQVADRARERRVRRGQVEFDARFDLHGLTQAAAEQALPAFLSRQRHSGARCVLVITGKGRGGEGVLRRNFLHWLEAPGARALVSGVAPAHPRHGGSGAFYVFLRRQKA